MAKISVIVPVFKVEPYLKQCIDSILNQSFEDFELILVDDGSPDNCPAICDEYAKKDNRIIVIHKKNGGLSSARNAGLDYAFEHSNSEYISFIDSDDYVDNNYLKLLHQEIHECDVCVCSFKTFCDENVENTTFFDSLPLDLFTDKVGYWKIKNNGVLQTVAWNKLYKKNIFLDIRYPKGKIHEDDFVIHRIISKCNKIRIIPDYLYYYRKRKDSIMSSLNVVEHEFLVLEIYIDRANFYLTNDYLECYQKAFSQMVTVFNLDRRRAAPFFLEMKSLYAKRKKLRLKPKIKERMFFSMPSLYCFLRRLIHFLNE